MTQIMTEMSLQNSFALTCSLDGYPEVQMLDANGHTLPTHLTDATSAFLFTNLQPSMIALAPGTSAYFILQWSNVSAVTNQLCPTAPTSSSLRITPPGATDALTVTAALAPCDGNLTTSPIVATA